LNPAKECNGHNRGQIYHLTEIDNTIAVDENGNSWTLEYEQWIMDDLPKREIVGKISLGGYSREHVYFDLYKNGQLLLAQHILEELCKKCIDEPFGEINNIKLTEPVEFVDRATDSKIREILDSEASKAEQKLEFLFESLYVAKVFDWQFLLNGVKQPVDSYLKFLGKIYG